MKKSKLFVAILLLCMTALVFVGCSVKKEEADVILESWSEDTGTPNTVISSDIDNTVTEE